MMDSRRRSGADPRNAKPAEPPSNMARALMIVPSMKTHPMHNVGAAICRPLPVMFVNNGRQIAAPTALWRADCHPRLHYRLAVLPDDRPYANLLAKLAQTLEAHDTVRRCEKRIVAAYAYIMARMDMRPALAHQDIAGEHKLAVGPLDPEALAVAVAPVA